MPNRITFHSAHPTYHRWRVTTPDGHTIASSSASYLDRSEAHANVAGLFIDGLRSGRFVIEDEADREAVIVAARTFIHRDEVDRYGRLDTTPTTTA